jgi:hypothetical protein
MAKPVIVAVDDDLVLLFSVIRPRESRIVVRVD